MAIYAELFQQQNILVFACYPDKAPATPNGFNDATTDVEELRRQFPEGVDRAIGMPTGNASGLVVIDYDVNKSLNPKEKDGPKDPRSVDELKDELEARLGIKLPDTVEVETQHGGRHQYYKLEKATDLPSGTRVFDSSLPIDVRSNGGYVCTVDGTDRYTVYDDVDELGMTNLRERCAVCPPEILNFRKSSGLVTANGQTTTDVIRPPISDKEVRELRAALACIPSDGRDLWVNFGMGLKYIGQGDSLKGLWVEWSQKSDKYDPVDTEKTWAKLKPRGDIGFGSIVNEARKYGFVSVYEEAGERDVIRVKTEAEIAERMKTVVHKRQPFPKHLLRPKGFMGECIDYIESQAIKTQPILALAGVISFAGMLLGRKVEGDTGARTNVYIVGLGESGCGKDNIKATIKRIMVAYDKNKFNETCSVHDVTSDSAVYKTLAANPSQLFLIDELGMFLSATTGDSANPYLRAIQKALLTVYSDCDQITFGKTYVDSKNNIELNNPHLCIYGNANRKQFLDSITRDNVSDGLVSRMLVFESEDPDPQKREKIKMTPPSHIISQVDHLYRLPTNIQPGGNLDAMRNVMPLLVPKNDQAKAMLAAFDDEIWNYRNALRNSKRIDTVYNRAALSAEKLAIIYACTEDVYNPSPIITEEHMGWAIAIVRYSLDNMQYDVEYHIWESEYERNSKRILQIVRERGQATMTEIAVETQYLDEKARNGIMETLKTCRFVEEIFVDPKPGEKYSTKVFIAK